jgi:hypothetical protein
MNAVRKFIEVARSFRSGQMAQLQAPPTPFFTKAEVREGIKRMIHIKYIECI